MPYYRRRGRMYKRRYGRRRKLNRPQKAQVRRIITSRQELKFFVGTVTNTQMNTTASVTKLSAVTQGSTDNDRDGDRLRLSGFKLRYTVNKHLSNNTDPLEYARLIIFQWLPSDQIAAPTAAQILLTDPSIAGIGPRSMYSHDTRQLYRVLYDKVHTMVGEGTVVATSPMQLNAMQSVVKKLKPHKKMRRNVQFFAGATTGTGHIYALYVGSTATNAMQLNLSLKITYTDG